MYVKDVKENVRVAMTVGINKIKPWNVILVRTNASVVVMPFDKKNLDSNVLVEEALFLTVKLKALKTKASVVGSFL